MYRRGGLNSIVYHMKSLASINPMVVAPIASADVKDEGEVKKVMSSMYTAL